MRARQLKEILNIVNDSRQIILKSEKQSIIRSVYIDLDTHSLTYGMIIFSQDTIENECKNCINENDCPDDVPQGMEGHCEFIHKNKIILYEL